MQVKPKAIATTLGLVISGITGILLAYCGFSYWGIATQSIVYIAVLNLYLWCVCPWRPSWTIRFAPLKGMLGFSSKMLFTNIFNHINNNIFSIILGRFYTEKEVGDYNQANSWNYKGHVLITGMVNSVAQPLFVQVADDAERQVRAFRKMLRFTAFISFPAMLGISLIAPELIVIALTDKWATSARILQLLAIGGAFIPLSGLYTNMLISKGKSDIYLKNTVALGISQLGVMLFLYSFGIFTMISVYVCINIAWLGVWHYFVRREIRLDYGLALKDILPYLVIASASMLITQYATSSIENIYLLIMAKILLAATLYTLSVWLLGSTTFQECLGYLRKKNRIE